MTVDGLREYDVVQPPTSLEVQQAARDALDLETGDKKMIITVLGRFAIPKPEEETYTFQIKRSVYEDEGGRIISGSTEEGQVVVIHASGSPEEPATATIVG